MQIVPGSNAHAKPLTVMIISNDAHSAYVAVAASSRRPVNVTLVAVAHWFEDCLALIESHIEDFILARIQKVLAHPDWFENLVFVVNSQLALSEMLCFF